MDNRYFWLCLNFVEGLGIKTTLNLIEKFKNPENIFRASLKELIEVNGVNEVIAKDIINFSRQKEVEREIKLIELKGIKIVNILDSAYPENLRTIYDPPPVLYVKGGITLEDKHMLAIVGSRKASSYGIGVAERLASDLAMNGITVVSGMAIGIDSSAHTGAISVNGRTVAVLGSGIDVVYPKENMNLYEKISECGAVLSEFPMGTKPFSGNFPQRNRLISGLSLGVVIVEASQKSGSLITAGFALEQGREVFAVPGNITSPTSKGTNRLIKQGAKLVECMDDIIEELKIDRKIVFSEDRNARRDLKLDHEEEKLMSFICDEPIHIDDIKNKSNFEIEKVAGILLTLEIKGLVKQLPGKYFIKTI